MQILTQLTAAGKLDPIIDKAFALAEAPEALRYLQSGRAHGKLVITVP